MNRHFPSQMIEIDPKGVRTGRIRCSSSLLTLLSLSVIMTDPLLLLLLQRVVMMDSDMIVMRNMDELMELELPSDWISAAHACACNPRKLAHYPADW
jgi:hypothetical protein